MSVIDLSGIDWVVAKGESDSGNRGMERRWVESRRDQCLAAGVKFLFEQWAGTQKKTGRLDKRTEDEMPEILAVTVPSKKVRVGFAVLGEGKT